MPKTQSHRAASLTTSLGDDKLLVQSLRVTEQLGRLFQIELSLASEESGIAADELIGQAVTIALELDDRGEEHRYFSGIVNRFSMVDAVGQLPQYSMTVVPFIWFLGRTSDCRTWQKVTAPDIIQGLIKEKGYSDLKVSLHDTYAEREFCVQYRETALNYVSRLMEEEGICYFFQHANGSHTMVITDTLSGHDNVATLLFEKSASGDDTDRVTEWTLEQEAQSGKYALTDYDFTAPNKDLLSSADSPLGHGHADLEMMDFPGGFTTPGDGDRLTKVRLEEAQAHYQVVRGQTSFRGLYAGSIFTLKEHPLDSQNANWLVTSISLSAATDEFSSGASDASDTHFSCSFTAIPAKTTYRPPRLTPEPLITGPQTALVVGPAGGEIYTDKYGRIKLHFYWDRHDQFDENSSCWVRVAQTWAGKNWGGTVIPRIGMEVIVHFIDGDPDRPLVAGCVYNGTNMPSSELPAGSAKSGLKSNSTKGGGGSNEITMDDTKGKENMIIHAQYDQNSTVEHDQNNIVHNNRTTSVDVDDAETIGSNQTMSVGAKQKLTVASDQETSVGANQKLAVSSNQTITVGADQKLTVNSNQKYNVGADQEVTIASNRKLNVGAALTEAISGNRKTSVGGTDTLSVTGAMKINGSATIEIAGGTSIKLSAGGSSIEISASGIKITSPAIVDVKGAMVKHNG
jgi:type VI secretion system secreted protein VgrG